VQNGQLHKRVWKNKGFCAKPLSRILDPARRRMVMKHCHAIKLCGAVMMVKATSILCLTSRAHVAGDMTLAIFIGGATMRAYLLAAAMLLCSLPAQAVDGFNLPGSDYVNFDASSAFVCRNSCGGDSRCQAWTWVKPGIQGPMGHCWLKDRVPTLVKDNCCNSGSRENIAKRDLKAEDRTNRPGSDYNNFVTDSWQTCETACANDQMCAAWTYVRRGIQGPRGRCWLKASVPHPVADQNTVSGVKFRPRSVRID
jgi:hypothetical protein